MRLPLTCADLPFMRRNVVGLPLSLRPSAGVWRRWFVFGARCVKLSRPRDHRDVQAALVAQGWPFVVPR